jgi:hypothetical protein
MALRFTGRAFRRSSALLSLIISLGVTDPAWAKKAPLKAHAHGSARLDVASQEKNLELSLEVPASEVWGFEHKPQSASEVKKSESGLLELRKNVLAQFVLPESLSCKVTKALVETHYEDHHADISANYQIACEKPLKGKTLKLGLLETFPSIKTVKVQVLNDAGARGFQITSKAQEIDL